MSFTEWWDGLSVANKTFGIVAVAIFVIALLCLIIGLFVSNNKYKKTRKIRNKENEKGKEQEQQKVDAKLQEQIERLKEEIKNIKDIKQPEVKPSKDYTNDFADLKVQNAEIKAKYDALSSMIRNQPQNTQISRDPEIQDLKRQLEATNKKLDEQAKSLSDLKTNQQQQPKEQPNQDAQKESKDSNAKNNQQPAQPAQPPVYYPLAPQVVNPAMGGGYQPLAPINGYPAQQVVNPAMGGGYPQPAVTNPMFAGGYVPQFSPQAVGTVPATIASQPIQPVVAATPTVSGHVSEIVQPVVRRVYVDRPADDSYLDGPYNSFDIGNPEYPRRYLVHGPYRDRFQRYNNYNPPIDNPNGNNLGNNSRLPAPNSNNDNQINALKDMMNDFQEQNKAMINNVQEKNKAMINKIEENNDKWQQKQEDRLQEQEDKFKELIESLGNNQPGNRKKNPFNWPFDKKKKKKDSNPNDNENDDENRDEMDDLEEIIKNGKKKLDQQFQKPKKLDYDMLEPISDKVQNLVDEVEKQEKNIANKTLEEEESGEEVFTANDVGKLVELKEQLGKCQEELNELESRCAKNEDETVALEDKDAEETYNAIIQDITENTETLDALISEVKGRLSQKEKEKLDKLLENKQEPLHDDDYYKQFGKYADQVKFIDNVIKDGKKPISERKYLCNVSKICCKLFATEDLQKIKSINDDNAISSQAKKIIEQKIDNAADIFKEVYQEDDINKLTAMAIREKNIISWLLNNQGQRDQAKQYRSQHWWFYPKTGIPALIQEIQTYAPASAHNLEGEWKTVLQELGLHDLYKNNEQTQNPEGEGNEEKGNNREVPGGARRQNNKFRQDIQMADNAVNEANDLLNDKQANPLQDPKVYIDIMGKLNNASNQLNNTKYDWIEFNGNTWEAARAKVLKTQQSVTNDFLNNVGGQNDHASNWAHKLQYIDNQINQLNMQAGDINTKNKITKQLFADNWKKLDGQLTNIQTQLTGRRQMDPFMQNALLMANRAKQNKLRQLLGGAQLREENKLVQANLKSDELLKGKPEILELTNHINHLRNIVNETSGELLGANGQKAFIVLQNNLRALQQKYQTQIQGYAKTKGKIVPTVNPDPFTTFCGLYHDQMQKINTQINKEPKQTKQIDASQILYSTLYIFAICRGYIETMKNKGDEKGRIKIVNEMLKDTICTLVYRCAYKDIRGQDKQKINRLFDDICKMLDYRLDEKNTKIIINTINEARRANNSKTPLILPTNNITESYNIEQFKQIIVIKTDLFKEHKFDPELYEEDTLFLAKKDHLIQSQLLPAIQIVKTDLSANDAPPVYLCYEEQNRNNPQSRMLLHAPDGIYEITNLAFETDNDENKEWGILKATYNDRNNKKQVIEMNIRLNSPSLNQQTLDLLKTTTNGKTSNPNISPDNFYNNVIAPLIQQQCNKPSYEMEAQQNGIIKFSPISLNAQEYSLDSKKEKLNGQSIRQVFYLPERRSLAITTGNNDNNIEYTIIPIRNYQLLEDAFKDNNILAKKAINLKNSDLRILYDNIKTADKKPFNEKNSVDEDGNDDLSDLFEIVHNNNVHVDIKIKHAYNINTKEKCDIFVSLGKQDNMIYFGVEEGLQTQQQDIPLTKNNGQWTINEEFAIPQKTGEALAGFSNPYYNMPDSFSVNIEQDGLRRLADKLINKQKQSNDSFDDDQESNDNSTVEWCGIEVVKMNHPNIPELGLPEGSCCGLRINKNVVAIPLNGDIFLYDRTTEKLSNEKTIQPEELPPAFRKIFPGLNDKTIFTAIASVINAVLIKHKASKELFVKFDDVTDVQQQAFDALQEYEKKLKAMNDSNQNEKLFEGLTDFYCGVRVVRVLDGQLAGKLGLQINSTEVAVLDPDEDKMFLFNKDNGIWSELPGGKIDSNTIGVNFPNNIAHHYSTGDLAAIINTIADIDGLYPNKVYIGDKRHAPNEQVKSDLLANNKMLQDLQQSKFNGNVFDNSQGIKVYENSDKPVTDFNYGQVMSLETNQGKCIGLKVLPNTIAIPVKFPDGNYHLYTYNTTDHTFKEVSSVEKKWAFKNLTEILPQDNNDAYNTVDIAAAINATLMKKKVDNKYCIYTDDNVINEATKNTLEAFNKYEWNAKTPFEYFGDTVCGVRIVKHKKNKDAGLDYYHSDTWGLQIDSNTVVEPIDQNTIRLFDINNGSPISNEEDRIDAKYLPLSLINATGYQDAWNSERICRVINAVSRINGNNNAEVFMLFKPNGVNDEITKKLLNYMNSQLKIFGNTLQPVAQACGIEVVSVKVTIGGTTRNVAGLKINNNSIVIPYNGKIYDFNTTTQEYVTVEKIPLDAVKPEFCAALPWLTNCDHNILIAMINAILTSKGKAGQCIKLKTNELKKLQTEAANRLLAYQKQLNDLKNDPIKGFSPALQQHFGVKVVECMFNKKTPQYGLLFPSNLVYIPFGDGQNYINVYNYNTGEFKHQIGSNQVVLIDQSSEFSKEFKEFLKNTSGHLNGDKAWEILKAILFLEKGINNLGTVDNNIVNILKGNAKVPPPMKQINNDDQNENAVFTPISDPCCGGRVMQCIYDSRRVWGLKINDTTVAVPEYNGKIHLLDINTGKQMVNDVDVIPNENIHVNLKLASGWNGNDWNYKNLYKIMNAINSITNATKYVFEDMVDDELEKRMRAYMKMDEAKLNNNNDQDKVKFTSVSKPCCGVRIVQVNDMYGLQINDDFVAVPYYKSWEGIQFFNIHTGESFGPHDNVNRKNINDDLLKAANLNRDYTSDDISMIIKAIAEIQGIKGIDIGDENSKPSENFKNQLQTYDNNMNNFNNMNNNPLQCKFISNKHFGAQVAECKIGKSTAYGLVFDSVNYRIYVPYPNGDRIDSYDLSTGNLMEQIKINEGIDAEHLPNEFVKQFKQFLDANNGALTTELCFDIMHAILTVDGKKKFNTPVNNNIVNILQGKGIEDDDQYNLPIATITPDCCGVEVVQIDSRWFGLKISQNTILVPFPEAEKIEVYNVNNNTATLNNKCDDISTDQMPQEFRNASGWDGECNAGHICAIIKAISTICNFDNKVMSNWPENSKLEKDLKNNMKNFNNINNKPKHKIEHWSSLGNIVEFQRIYNQDDQNTINLCLLLTDGRLATVKVQQNDNQIYIFNPTTDNWAAPIPKLPLNLVSPYIQKVLNWNDPLSSQDLADLIQANVSSGGIKWANKKRADAIYAEFQKFQANNMKNLNNINNKKIGSSGFNLNNNNNFGINQPK